MERWKASVIESIDFQNDLKGVDLKDNKNALNCAHYAESVHTHCLKTEND